MMRSRQRSLICMLGTFLALFIGVLLNAPFAQEPPRADAVQACEEKVQNVEWMDWDGTPHPHRYRDWGKPEQMPPVICYNSPTVLAELSRIARTVIGPALVDGLNRLETAGKGYLFAGVTVGAEPVLPNYEVIAQVNPRAIRTLPSLSQ